MFRCSEEDYWRLARLRDAVISLKSLAANLEFLSSAEPAKWLPEELKAFYIETASNARKRASGLEREIKELESKCFMGKKIKD